MEAVRTLKANLKLEHKPCGWCQIELQLGEDAAVCTACEGAHHQRCWDSRAGCATAGCANAPLARLDPAPGSAPGSAPGIAAAAAPALRELSPGMMRCPQCSKAIPEGTLICSFCRSVTSPDGIYHGPKINAPGATAALVYGIVGFFVCGIVLGPLAISKANAAKRAMAENPTYGGAGLATAGTVLGVIDIIGWAIVLILRMGGSA